MTSSPKNEQEHILLPVHPNTLGIDIYKSSKKRVNTIVLARVAQSMASAANQR